MDRYVIAYAVWEASPLPKAYLENIALVQEVWTSSCYCAGLFGVCHPKVAVIPHVASRLDSSTARDHDAVAAHLGASEGTVRFLCFGRLWDKRKNIEGLIAAFAATRKDMPQARLVIKSSSNEYDKSLKLVDPRIIPLSEDMTNAQIDALYSATDLFVSPHRSEGWGLCISDALSLGCLVAATNYAGPTDFLTQENCIQLPFEVKKITPAEAYGFFEPGMEWAEPDRDSLQDVLQQFYFDPLSDASQDRRRLGREVNVTFSRQRIAALLQQRILSLSWLAKAK
jgi:glycosyltransferase involved in cell wall biosynthesis